MPIDPGDPRLQKVAYARIVGEGIDVYVRKFEVMMGRTSKSTALDVVLGDNMNISRQHAKLVFNFETKNYELIVMGKNGAHVNGALYTPASPPQPIRSQDLLSIADKSFHFLLPRASNAPGQPTKARAPAVPKAKRPAEPMAGTSPSPKRQAQPKPTTQPSGDAMDASRPEQPEHHSSSEAAAPPSRPVMQQEQGHGAAPSAPEQEERKQQSQGLQLSHSHEQQATMPHQASLPMQDQSQEPKVHTCMAAHTAQDDMARTHECMTHRACTRTGQ
jgi:hypothetical protein